MQKTIENCSLIRHCVKKGIGEPDRFFYVNKCGGYKQENTVDELCDQCKKCKYCIYKNEDDKNETAHE